MLDALIDKKATFLSRNHRISDTSFFNEFLPHGHFSKTKDTSELAYGNRSYGDGDHRSNRTREDVIKVLLE
jgi:hypothetical protein